jgi:predicted transcriptional regulator
MARYRRRFEIIAAILNVAVKGAKKTRIMYFANLSYRLLEKYLEQTIDMGFVKPNGDDYEVTEKGRNFLERYAQFSGRYSELEGQLEKLRFEREVLEKICEPQENAGFKLAKTKRLIE